MTGQMIINTSDFHFATEDLHATSEIIPTTLSVYPTKVATSSDNDIMPFLWKEKLFGVALITTGIPKFQL